MPWRSAAGARCISAIVTRIRSTLVALHDTISSMCNEEHFQRALGQVIAARRRRQGISQETLAAIAHMSRTYIGDIERGARNIAISNVVKVANALGTTPSGLLAEVETVLSDEARR